MHPQTHAPNDTQTDTRAHVHTHARTHTHALLPARTTPHIRLRAHTQTHAVAHALQDTKEVVEETLVKGVSTVDIATGIERMGDKV